MTRHPRVEVSLLEGPLEPWRPPAVDGAGAVLSFEGRVRGTESGLPIRGLTYEQYPPMTERELARLAAEVAGAHGVLSVEVRHSYGLVPVGACSFQLVVTSAHRREGIAAVADFIDRLKREIPLWKVPES